LINNRRRHIDRERSLATWCARKRIASHTTPRLVGPVTVNSGKPSLCDFLSWRCLRISDNASMSMSTRRPIFVFRTPVPRYEIFRRISSPKWPTVTTTMKSKTILIERHGSLSHASLVRPVKSNLFPPGQSTPWIGTRLSE
jgi:hypothetical protein